MVVGGGGGGGSLRVLSLNPTTVLVVLLFGLWLLLDCDKKLPMFFHKTYVSRRLSEELFHFFRLHYRQFDLLNTY